MIVSIHQPCYWPWLGLIDKIRRGDVHVVLDDCRVNWIGYQRRTLIQADNAQGCQYLQVPCVKATRHAPANQVQIDSDRTYKAGDWRQETLRLLELSYRKAPFFREVMDPVRRVMGRPFASLAELNIQTLRCVMELLEVDVPLLFSSDLKSDQKKDELMLDLTLKAGADVYLSGQGAKAYMNDARFHEKGVRVMYQEFVHPVYPQGRAAFTAGLSSLDILFHLGPQKAAEAIRTAAAPRMQEAAL